MLPKVDHASFPATCFAAKMLHAQFVSHRKRKELSRVFTVVSYTKLLLIIRTGFSYIFYTKHQYSIKTINLLQLFNNLSDMLPVIAQTSAIQYQTFRTKNPAKNTHQPLLIKPNIYSLLANPKTKTRFFKTSFPVLTSVSLSYRPP